MRKPGWSLYILLCRDGTFYTGVTKDTARRLKQHRDGRGSKYTRGRRPVRVVYTERCAGRSVALKREYAVKSLSRREKEELIRMTGKQA